MVNSRSGPALNLIFIKDACASACRDLRLVPIAAAPNGRTFRGEDHTDDWGHLDVVVAKCDCAKKVGGRALRSRPQEVVPRCSTGKQQPPDLLEGAHPRCVIPMPSDAC
jgi:hypothetical protein